MASFMNKAFKIARRKKTLSQNAATALHIGRRNLLCAALVVFVINVLLGMVLHEFLFSRARGSYSFIEILYASVVMISTVGFGDYTVANHDLARAIGGVYILSSTITSAWCLTTLIQFAATGKQRRIIESELSQSEIFEADLDDDKQLSKAEFILFKLRRLHPEIDDHEVMALEQQFEQKLLRATSDSDTDDPSNNNNNDNDNDDDDVEMLANADQLVVREAVKVTPDEMNNDDEANQNDLVSPRTEPALSDVDDDQSSSSTESLILDTVR
jgi:hypothetical protein